MYRQKPIYPVHYYPQYSRDPRHQADPRYYGYRPSYKSPYSPVSPGIGPAHIVVCAFVLVVLFVVIIIGVGLGLGFGLSSSNGSSNETTSTTNDGSVAIQPPEVPVDPRNFVTVDTTIDTVVSYNSDFANTSSPAFQGLSELVLPSIDRSFRGSSVESIYAGSQLISAINLNGNTRIESRTFLRAAPPLDVTSTSSALLSAETLVESILMTDSLDGSIGDIGNSVGVVPNGVQSTRNGITSTSPTSQDTTTSLSAVCPSNIVRFADSGQDTVAVIWNAPTVSGNVGNVMFTYSPDINSSFSVGTTTVVATVTDSRESVQCNFNVIVRANTESLSIICPPNIMKNTNAGESVATVEFGEVQISGQQGRSTAVSYSPSPGNFPVGVTPVTVTVQDGASMTSCIFDVTVRDNEQPILTCPSGGTVGTDQGRNYATISWTIPTVTDNVDNILVVSTSRNPGQYPRGSYEIRATVTDRSGNSASCTWSYNVVDNENPVIACPSSFTVWIPPSFTTVDVSFDNRVSVADNIPGVTTNFDRSDLRPFGAGTYSITATATDTSGNTASCTFTLIVSASCGRGNLTLHPRIIGGDDAGAGQYPWMASLGGASHFCGSVIINENWLISAAHCFGGSSVVGVTVIAGDVSVVSATTNRQTRTVSQMIVHPSYVAIPNHDIVLLRLDQALTFTNYVTPACLTLETEEANLYATNLCYVAGWGITMVGTNEPSDTLQAVRINVYDTETCRNRFSGALSGITSNSICAGFPQGGSDACEGDSGGGLVCPDATNQWHVVGVVSSGVGCANPNSPGLYTRVSQYIDFIYAYVGAELVIVEPSTSPKILASPTESAGSQNYPNDAVKGWRFRRLNANFIRLDFKRVDLASGDTLTLGRGLDPSDSSSIISTIDAGFTGTIQDRSETDIWFRFVSDRQTTATGFLIEIEAVN